MENILRIRFSGRLRRNRFWPTYIVLWVLSCVFNALIAQAGDSAIIILLITLLSLYLSLVGLGLCIRRLHDTGRSGWWVLIAFVPFIGILALFIFFCLDSKPGSNQWGPNPKELA